MNQNWFRRAAEVLVLAVVICSCCSDEKVPLQPLPAEEDKHLFYVASAAGGRVRVFSVEERKFIDSLYFEDIPSDTIIKQLHVFGDDERLSASWSGGTAIMDLRTKEILEDYNLHLHFSPDSRHYLILTPGRPCWELNTYPEHETVYCDPEYPYLPRFSNNSKCLSYLHSLYDDRLQLRPVTFHIESDSLIVDPKYRSGEELCVFFPCVIPQKNKVFFLGDGWNSGTICCASEIGSDSTRILMQFITGTGMYPVISPDDRFLYFTNLPSWDWPTPDVIYVYDTETEEQTAVISLEEVFEPETFEFTSDGQYLLIRSTTGFAGDNSSEVCLVNAVSNRIIGTFDYGETPGCIGAN